jgi:hypothetical protein
MTDRQQSAFFFAIVFLFTSGIGLVIYRQYDLYYEQNTDISIETAQTPAVALEKSSASSTLSQTSDWKTYKNTEYGFEFGYPASWQIEPDDTGVSVEKPGNFSGDGDGPSPVVLVVVRQRAAPTNTNDIVEYYMSQYSAPGVSIPVESSEKIEVDGQLAYHITWIGSPVYHNDIVFYYNGYEYTIENNYSSTDGQLAKEVINVAQHMASTFKFTN